MITRFDHAVIGVRDLDRAIQCYQALGFDVRPGGQHPGWGTHNAIIRFGLDYIELLAVHNEAEAHGPRTRVLADFLRKREGGLVGYALATTSIQQDAHRLSGIAGGEPFAMQRMRPDGKLLKWQLMMPENIAWRRPWPFLIQWDIPDEQRLTWEAPGTHKNGASQWTAITVVVRDLEQMCDLYQHKLGLEPGPHDEVPYLAAHRASFYLDSSRIDLLTPIGAGPIQQMIDDSGEGPYEITLAVKDLQQARSYLTGAGIELEPHPTNPASVLIAPRQALGARLVMTQQGATS